MSDVSLVRCCACHAEILLRPAVEERLRKSKQDFYCLNGHRQSFTKSTWELENDELRAQLRAKDSVIASKESEAARLAREVKQCRMAATEKTRTCEHCDRVFATVRAMRAHRTRAHSSIKRLPAKASPDVYGAG